MEEKSKSERFIYRENHTRKNKEFFKKKKYEKICITR